MFSFVLERGCRGGSCAPHSGRESSLEKPPTPFPRMQFSPIPFLPINSTQRSTFQSVSRPKVGTQTALCSFRSAPQGRRFRRRFSSVYQPGMHSRAHRNFWRLCRRRELITYAETQLLSSVASSVSRHKLCPALSLSRAEYEWKIGNYFELVALTLSVGAKAATRSDEKGNQFVAQCADCARCAMRMYHFASFSITSVISSARQALGCFHVSNMIARLLTTKQSENIGFVFRPFHSLLSSSASLSLASARLAGLASVHFTSAASSSATA